MDVATDVAALDAAVDRIRKHIPAQPYLQVIPQDEPRRFRHYNRHSAESWLRGTPFDSSESSAIQYQTWFYREHGSDTIHLRVPDQSALQPSPSHQTSRSHLPAANAGRPAMVPPPVNTPSRDAAADALPGGAARKKISLAAYKKTAGSQTTSPLPATSASTKPVQGTLKRKLASTNSDEGPVKRQRSLTPLQAKTPPRSEALLPDRLSPLTTLPTDVARKPSPANLTPSPNRPTLPPRLSPLKVCAPKRDQVNDNALPGRLSPLSMAPAPALGSIKNRKEQDRANKHDSSRTRSPAPIALPSPISPTLPNVIIRGLKERAAQKGNSNDNDSASRAPVAKKSRNVDETSGPAEKSQRRIVKLTIPKRMRIDFRRLLQFSPKSKHPQNTSSGAVDSATATHSELVTAKNEDKSLDVSSKTQNATVVAGLAQDGRLPTGGSRKDEYNSAQLITPPPGADPSPKRPSQTSPLTGRKEARAIAASIARGESNESIANVASPTSPSVSDLSHSHRPSPRIGSISAAKTTESQAWWVEREKFMDLAKKLKKRHAADHAERAAACRSNKPEDAKRESKLAALTNIESLAAFMLSFHCHHTSYANRAPAILWASPKETWYTLHGFWRFVNNACTPWPILQSLVCALGQVYNVRIMNALTLGGTAGSATATTTTGLVRGGPEEKESVTMFSKAVAGPPMGRDVAVAALLAKHGRAPIGAQTPVLEAVETVVVMLELLEDSNLLGGGVVPDARSNNDDEIQRPVVQRKFSSRLKKAMLATPLLLASETAPAATAGS